MVHPGSISWLRQRCDVNGCWIWCGAINGSGYGVVRIPGVRSPKMAHRAAWEAINGPVPPGMEVDHICNVRACCNPDHLQCITHAENIALRWSRNPAKPKPPRTKMPTASIRVRPGKNGTRYAVLWRDYSEDSPKQTSRTFATEDEARAFLATLPIGPRARWAS